MLAQAPTAPGAIPRRPTAAQAGSWNGFYSRYVTQTIPDIQAGIASGEICAMVQQWANYNAVPIAVWTPTDQHLADKLIEYGNRLVRVVDGLGAGKYFLAFKGGKMAAVAPELMPREQYENDLFPEEGSEGFGVIPIIVWVIIGGVTLVGSLWGASEIIEAEADRQTAKNQAAIIAADQKIAASDPATRQAWKQFKQQNAQILADKAKAADQADDGGLFAKLFGKSAAKGIGMALGIAAALAGLLVVSRMVPEKKKA